MSNEIDARFSKLERHIAWVEFRQKEVARRVVNALRLIAAPEGVDCEPCLKMALRLLNDCQKCEFDAGAEPEINPFGTEIL